MKNRTTKDIINELKEAGFIKKENVTYATWNGKCLKSHALYLYKLYLERGAV